MGPGASYGVPYATYPWETTPTRHAPARGAPAAGPLPASCTCARHIAIPTHLGRQAGPRANGGAGRVRPPPGRKAGAGLHRRTTGPAAPVRGRATLQAPLGYTRRPAAMCGTLRKRKHATRLEGAAANRRTAGTHAASMGLTAGSAPTRPPRPRCRTRAARRAGRPPRRATRCGTRPPAARWSRPGRRGTRVSARRRRARPGVLARGGPRAGRCAQPTGTTASPSCAWPSPHTCAAAPRPRGLPLGRTLYYTPAPRAPGSSW